MKQMQLNVITTSPGLTRIQFYEQNIKKLMVFLLISKIIKQYFFLISCLVDYLQNIVLIHLQQL